MSKIRHKDNPDKWRAFIDVADAQILAAFSKLRRIGFPDCEIIERANLILEKVRPLEIKEAAKE